MSLLWIDGFDSYGTSVGNQVSPAGVLAQKYSGADANTYIRVGDGLWSGYSLQLSNSTPAPTTPSINTHATLIVGFWYKHTHTTDTSSNVVSLRDGSTSNMFLRLDPVNGKMQVYAGASTLVTEFDYVDSSAWQFIEFKITVADAGSYEVRVGGETKASGSRDTKYGSNNYCDNVRLFGNSLNNAYNFYDHLYICNGAGSTQNDFLGPVKVVTVRPSGDTAEADWTTQSGTDHYAMVDESVQDDDTTYVEAGTSGHYDLYQYSNPADLGSTIHGIQINTDCKETDATTFSLKTVIESDGTTSEDTAQAIGSASYKTLRRLAVTDPKTGSAWTSSGINAAQFGVKVG